MKLSTQLRVAGCGVLLFVLASCQAHYDGAYMRNADDGFKSRMNWMSTLKDDVKLSELALPGTHNSAAYKKLASEDSLVQGFFEAVLSDWSNKEPIQSFNQLGDVVKLDMYTNQVLNLRQQLQYGIRAFDVGVVISKNKFGLMHKEKESFLNLMFDDFLVQIANFLGENPSETVVFTLSIRAEVGESSKTPKAILQEYLQDSRFSKFYLKPSSSQVTLGQARGKFVVISKDVNFNDSGLDGNGGDFVTMDTCYLSTNWDLHDKKWMPAKNHIKAAHSGDKNKYYIDYLSGYGGSFPYFVASGHSSPWTSAARLATGLTTPGFSKYYPDFPRVSCFIGICTIAFEGTNMMARDYINGYNKDQAQPQRSVGIIFADFPGDNLIETIVNNNVKLMK